MVSLLAAGLAGCLNAQSDDGPALISRIHTLTIDSATEALVEEHEDDFEALLRELLRTDLVVRVDEAGDYTLQYADKNGAIQNQTLAGMTPGEPRTVSGADPLAPATLRKGDEVVVTRAGIEGDWWTFGDVPLGFNMSNGAKGVYDFASRLEETVSLADLQVEEQGMTVESAEFELVLPIQGTMGYELGDETPEGAPLTLTGSVEVPPSAGDLLSLEVQATVNGQPGTAGMIAGVDEARASGSFRMWWQGGQPVAAQFLGGEYEADPRAIAWAEGAFADLAEGQNCAGKTKADRCEPEQLESVSETIPADEKEVIEASDLPRSTDETAARAIEALRQLFALDIVSHDKLTITIVADEAQLGMAGPDGPEFMSRVDFTMEAVAEDEVSVPAGSFDTLRITEEIRTQMQVANLENPETGQVAVRDFDMDEIVARNTFWLEKGTNRPIKMEASTPVNVDALLKRMVDAVDPSVWEPLGGKPIEDSDWRVTLNAESSYEAKELSGATHYSAFVGLALAHAIASSSSTPMTWAMQSAGAGFMPGYGGGYDEATGYEYGEDAPMFPKPEDRPARTLALTSSGPLVDGVKTYTVSDATGAWSDLLVSVDGMDLYPAWSESGCATPIEGEYALCRAGEALEGWEDVTPGDELRVYAASGSTLRILDHATNSVILTVTVS